jgi:PKD repeat protein
VGDTVTLDGSASHDVDGDGLTYAWSLTSAPAGSTAVLSDTTAVKPAFVMDLSGTYVAQLIVNDSKVDSAPDSVNISTDNSAPVADAGADQSGLVGDRVTLDGSGSYDVDADRLTYAWSLTTVPAGSTATLSKAASLRPAFLMDLPGTYVAQLIVSDSTVGSAPDTVTIITANVAAPTADAGGPYTGTVGVAVLFDGSGSTDTDGTITTYAWDFGDGSTGTGVSPSHSYAAGTWTVTLTVTDDGGLMHTSTTTATIHQPATLDLDIESFRATKRIRLSSRKQPPVVSIKLIVKNNSMATGTTLATIKGVQEDGSVLKTFMLEVSDAVGNGRSTYELVYEADASVNPGSIVWTASFNDGDPDKDEASVTTLVIQ